MLHLALVGLIDPFSLLLMHQLLLQLELLRLLVLPELFHLLHQPFLLIKNLHRYLIRTSQVTPPLLPHFLLLIFQRFLLFRLYPLPVLGLLL